MAQVLEFVVLSLLVLPLSLESLKKPRSHGFTRFFAFESLLLLLVLNLPRWFDEPLSLLQVISWLLLLTSLVLAVHGYRLLRVIGSPMGHFENTTRLVIVGAYKHIRHPMYASLIALAWGIFFKRPSFAGGLLALATVYFLYLTARREEAENRTKFGAEYVAYIAGTKMFVPHLF